MNQDFSSIHSGDDFVVECPSCGGNEVTVWKSEVPIRTYKRPKIVPVNHNCGDEYTGLIDRPEVYKRL